MDTHSINETASHAQSAEDNGDATASWNGGARLEVIANLAHELRTPIQVVMGYLEILRDEYEAEMSAEPRKLLERMNSNVHDLARTIDNMMEFVMADANAASMVAEDLTPASLMADIAPAIEAANQAKHLQVHLDLKEAPKIIRAPRRPLRSILLNLALNAIKFTPSGTVTIALRSALGRGRQETLEIEVTDTGPGMSPALLDQAAKPFTQLSKASARRYRGLGLGLAVVQRNLKALGGTLELHPAPGHGARFIVRIPQGSQRGAVKPTSMVTSRRAALIPPEAPRKGPSNPRPA